MSFANIKNNKRLLHMVLMGLLLPAIGFLVIFLYTKIEYTGCRQTDISAEEFLENSRLEGMNKADGNIVSVTEKDGCISYGGDEAEALQNIVINIEDLCDDYNGSDIYVVFKNGEEKHYIKEFAVGRNTLNLKNPLRNVESIRFQLLRNVGQACKIGPVTFNSAGMASARRWNEVGELYLRFLIVTVLLLINIGAVILGSKKPFKAESKVMSFLNRHYGTVMAILIFCVFQLCFLAGLGALAASAIFGYYIGSNLLAHGERTRFGAMVCGGFFAVTAIFAWCIYPDVSIAKLFWRTDAQNGLRMFICIIAGIIMGVCCIAYFGRKEEGFIEMNCRRLLGIGLNVAVIAFMTISLEVLAKIFFEKVGFFGAVREVVTFRAIVLSIFLTAIIYYFLKSLLGAVVGIFFDGLFFLFIFTGNFVKLRFHDSTFKPLDILQINDFLGIVYRYLPKILVILMVIFIVIMLTLLAYKKRKYIKEHKPNLVMAAVCLYMIVTMAGKINANKFYSMGINFNNAWRGTKENVYEQGIVCNSYIEFAKITKIRPKADEKYSKEYMRELKADFDALDSGNVSDIKPNVIVIMEESLFDITRVPEVELSMDVTENMHKYFKANTISPKYGGGTASVEFEALTGMSNYYFLDNIVPYITYWNSGKEAIPGIVDEFNASGYETTAIHPNDGGAYNRDMIYNSMHFDRFLDSDDMDFKRENLADDGFFKDSALFDVIKTQFESSDEPQFIFTVTIENHTMHKGKYDETEVKVKADGVSEEERNAFEQYSQGVLDCDRFLGEMVDLVENAKRPTILYVWGDHLPPLSGFNTLGFLKDKYNKYTTPLMAYSNYKSIEIGQEYITPNQLAPQILRDAEIKHSSYFDYIYSLREKFPVIQKEFVEDTEAEELNTYSMVQYDMLFGEKYLTDGKPAGDGQT